MNHLARTSLMFLGILGCLWRPAWAFQFTAGPAASGTSGTMTPFVSGGQQILDESVPQPFLSGLDFLGTGVTCVPNLLANKIECSVPGGPGGGSSIILDLGNNGTDSTGITKIITTGDTQNVFTESPADQLLINVGLLATAGQLNTHTGTTSAVHGSTASNTPNTIVQRDGSGNFAATQVTATTFVGALTGNATSATTAGALAAEGANCLNPGEAAQGVSTTGAAQGCFLAATIASTNVFTGRQDATGAASTAPNKFGTTAPATCAIGDTFFDTDAAAGRNSFGCTAPNTWTLQGDGQAAAGTVTASGTPNTGEVAVWTSSSEIEGVPTTGTGNVVRATSPTLTTPNLGTPSAINLTNATGLTMAQMPNVVKYAVTMAIMNGGG